MLAQLLICPNQVKEWLSQSDIQGVVSLVWIDFGEGVNVDFKDFIHHYDDLWYPSSDNLVILSLDGQRALTLSHEEILCRYKVSGGQLFQR